MSVAAAETVRDRSLDVVMPMKANQSSAVVTVAFLTCIAAIAMNILGINGTIPNTTILASVNLSLCGLSVIALCILADKEESRLKQVAKIAAFIAPIILFNTLALCGIAPFATSHILGWTSLAAAVVAFGVSLYFSGNSALKEVKAVREKYVKDFIDEGKKRFREIYQELCSDTGFLKHQDVPTQVLVTFQRAYGYCIAAKTDDEMLFARKEFLECYDTLMKDPQFAKDSSLTKDPGEFMSWVAIKYDGKFGK